MRMRRPLSSLRMAILPVCVALTALSAFADASLDATPTLRGTTSIQLPLGWKLQSSDSNRIVLAASAPSSDTDNTGDYAPVIVVTSAPGTTIDAEAQQKNLREDFPSYQPNETPTHVSINGIDAVTFGGTFSAGAPKLRSRQYLLAIGGRIYTITLTVLDSHWPQHVEAAVASIMTFKVTTK